MPVVVQAGGAHRNHLTLDVEERQILLEYEEDRFPFHHRLLFHAISPGVWVVGTPTLDVYSENLAGESIYPFQRAHVFPEDTRPAFTFGALSADQLADMRQRAFQLAEVLGGAPVVALGNSNWVFADTAHDRFGEAVPGEWLIGNRFVVRDAVALVQEHCDDGSDVWTTAENVRPAHMDDWLSGKREAAGRDKRLLPLAAPGVGSAPLTFSEAFAEASLSSTISARFTGPSAVRELCMSIAQSRLDPNAYAVQWKTASGVTAQSALAYEHRMLVTALGLMVCEDRLDPTQLSVAEHLGRRVLQIEKAVRKNHRQPEFDGLEMYMKHLADAGLGAQAPVFETHMAEQMKAEAQVLKQSRMAREETAALQKEKGPRADAKPKPKPKPKKAD